MPSCLSFLNLSAWRSTICTHGQFSTRVCSFLLARDRRNYRSHYKICAISRRFMFPLNLPPHTPCHKQVSSRSVFIFESDLNIMVFLVYNSYRKSIYFAVEKYFYYLFLSVYAIIKTRLTYVKSLVSLDKIPQHVLQYSGGLR